MSRSDRDIHLAARLEAQAAQFQVKPTSRQTQGTCRLRDIPAGAVESSLNHVTFRSEYPPRSATRGPGGAISSKAHVSSDPGNVPSPRYSRRRGREQPESCHV